MTEIMTHNFWELIENANRLMGANKSAGFNHQLFQREPK